GAVQLTNFPTGLLYFNFQPYDMTAANGLVYFFAQRTSPKFNLPGVALWKSDGTPEGTTMVTVLPFTNYEPNDLVTVNGTIFFQDANSLWASDGTADGNRTLLTPAVDSFPAIADLNAFDNKLYFTTHVGIASNGSQQFDGELWTSDGTVAGTVAVPGLPITR